jgi:hypothetical protein
LCSGSTREIKIVIFHLPDRPSNLRSKEQGFLLRCAHHLPVCILSIILPHPLILPLQLTGSSFDTLQSGPCPNIKTRTQLCLLFKHYHAIQQRYFLLVQLDPVLNGYLVMLRSPQDTTIARSKSQLHLGPSATLDDRSSSRPAVLARRRLQL